MEDEVDRDSETEDKKNFQTIFMESLKKNLEDLLQADSKKVAGQEDSEEDQSTTETTQSGLWAQS